MTAQGRVLSKRARIRLLWLRLHRWVGLALMLLLLAMGISGMALVWPDATERLFHAERFEVLAADEQMPPSALLAAGGEALLHGSRPAQLQLGAPGSAAILSSEVGGPPFLNLGPPRRTHVWLDPADGHVLSVSVETPDALFVARAVHGHLLVSTEIRWLVALTGLFLLFMSGTGLWLWCPGLRSIWRSLRWRRQLGRSMNLHRHFGALASLGLIAQGLTGIFLALPWLLNSAPHDPPSAPTRPVVAPTQTLDAVQASAQQLAGTARLQMVQLPTEAAPSWLLGFSDGSEVSVDDASGTAELLPPEHDHHDGLSGLIHRLHGGDFGWLHRALLFATGLALSMLSITGLLLWDQGRKKRRG
ncbi:MAG: hypothetical protein DI568_01185 [Sphingomonas sp.]|nr:MAG: hypothetical protein DI568_01185 [Sphingomonas sp.]